MATINGTQGNDGLNGTSAPDTINAKDGRDTVHAGGGDDTVFGGAGDDLLFGQGGADFIGGGGGDDTINGGAGRDTASYGLATTAVGVDLSVGGAQDTHGAGVDTLISIENLSGSKFGDTLIGGAGANLLRGNAGNDQLSGGADDTLRGGAGFDTASILAAAGAVQIDLTIAGPQDTGGAGVMTFDSVEAIVGTAFNDFLTGTTGSEHFDGAGGDDLLVGGGSGDVLNGGLGDDILVADAFGAATLDGGPGDDSVTMLAGGTADGGHDFDELTVDVSAAAGAVTVDLRSSALIDLGANTHVKNFERYSVQFGSGDDTVRSGNHGDFLSGGGGADSLTGGAGADSLYGDVGDDTVHGGAGDDTLRGFDGDDVVSGDDGADTISGGVGKDLLMGGAGPDVFLFSSVADSPPNTAFSDVIGDLSDAEDVIDLHLIDANFNKAGDQAFVLVAAFDGHAGEAMLTVNGANTELALDTNGDGLANSTIVLSGHHGGFSGLVL